MEPKKPNENPKEKRRSRQEIIAEWIKRNGDRCPICGLPLDPKSCTIDHIIPRTFGGGDEIGNLQLLCGHCNRVKADKPFLGYQFEEYIKRLLNANGKYSVVTKYISVDGRIIDADIVFEKETNHGKDLFIAEVSIASSFTEEKVSQIIKRLLDYKEILPSVNAVLITPSELSKKYIEQINNNGIVLWDKEFLAQEFSAQIIEEEPSSFRAFFDLPAETIADVDEHQKLIDRLNACPAGWDSWVDYQNLVQNILEFLFCPPLNSPIPQSNDKNKKNRRDFILSNYSNKRDIWEFLRDRYDADYVVVDAKNSAKSISKNDVLQIANYLKQKGTGLFGIIIARKGTNSSSENTLRDVWIHDQKMIVVLNDVDVEQMILDKKNGEDPAKLILKKIEDFRLSI